MCVTPAIASDYCSLRENALSRRFGLITVVGLYVTRVQTVRNTFGQI